MNLGRSQGQSCICPEGVAYVSCASTHYERFDQENYSKICKLTNVKKRSILRDI